MSMERNEIELFVALDFVCNGFLRKNDTREAVSTLVTTLRRTADDWAENLETPDDPA